MNRYIKSIHLQNFQSYKDQVIEFQPGLNLLVGTSDSGKSAVLRAISFVLYNYPRKDTLVHHGEKEIKVTLEFSDGVKVTRIKGESRNAIIAIDAKGNKITKEKIDTEIPEEIRKLLGDPPQDDFNGLISYADQFSKMFLVDLSPTDLPRSLSHLTGIEILEESAKQLMQNYKSIEKQNKLDEKEYTNLLNESQMYSYIEEYESRLDLCAKKQESIAALEQKIQSLEVYNLDFDVDDNSLVLFELLLKNIKSIRKKIQSSVELTERLNKLELFSLFDDNSSASKDLNQIKSIVDVVNDLKNKMSLCNKESVAYSTLEKYNTEMISIKEKGQRLTDEYKIIKDKLETTKKDLESFKQKLVDENIQCDKCGSIIR